MNDNFVFNIVVESPKFTSLLWILVIIFTPSCLPTFHPFRTYKVNLTILLSCHVTCYGSKWQILRHLFYAVLCDIYLFLSWDFFTISSGFVPCFFSLTFLFLVRLFFRLRSGLYIYCNLHLPALHSLCLLQSLIILYTRLLYNRCSLS